MKPIVVLTLAVPVLLSTTDARQLLVGSGRTYKVPSAVVGVVQDGDTVQIDTGTYAGEVSTWTKNNLTLRGTGKYAHLVAPAVISNQKAIWVVQGKNTTIENIEFSNASVPDKNGAGIRQEGNIVAIRNCYFHDCEDGILGGGDSTSSVAIENSEFANCGYGDGYSHNMYIGNIAGFTLKSCYSHGAKEGHLVKTRAKTNYILYNRLTDEPNATASYELSFPDAGDAYVIGNLIEQASTSHNGAIIDYASEHFYYPTAKSLYVINNTVVNHRSGGTFVSFSAGATTAKVWNNLFVGTGTMISQPADTSHNIFATNAGLVNDATFDYHLTASSIAIDKGVDPGSAGGFGLTPTLQYVHPCASGGRPTIGVIDVGAYEFSPASIVDHRTSALAQRATGARLTRFRADGRLVPVDRKENCRDIGPAIMLNSRVRQSVLPGEM